MGLLPTGILGEINGSVGPVVTYLLNGQNVIRAKGKGSTKPPSLAQLANRQQMKVLTVFFKKATKFLKRGFGHLALGTKHNYHNLAVSANKSTAVLGEYPEQYIDYGKLTLSKGELAEAVHPAVERMENGLKFTWDCPPSLEFKFHTDQVMMLAYSPLLNRSVCIDSGAKRRAEQDVLPVSSDLLKEQLEVYISFVSDDRLQAADSIYLGTLSAI
ncbi:DUF6266 family protein [Pedobacter sp.]|uniref:DUF6266 family protein n=1 Tax=Pedobacter sp. TaxID=1411316 RepID=UPI003D7FC0B8